MASTPTPRKQVPQYESVAYRLDGLSLSEAAAMLLEIGVDYPGGKLDWGRHDEYSDREGLYVLHHRDETDAEMAKRHKLEERWQAEQLERDQRELVRLAAVLGKQVV